MHEQRLRDHLIFILERDTKTKNIFGCERRFELFFEDIKKDFISRKKIKIETSKKGGLKL